jgi:hypothetical protein
MDAVRMREPANVRKGGKVWLLDGGAGGKRPKSTRSSTSVRAIRFGNVDTKWMTFPHEESPENRGRADADRRILREATGFVGAPLPAVRKRIYCRLSDRGRRTVFGSENSSSPEIRGKIFADAAGDADIGRLSPLPAGKGRRSKNAAMKAACGEGQAGDPGGARFPDGCAGFCRERKASGHPISRDQVRR